MSIAALRNVSFTYPGGKRPALKNCTLSLEPGALILLTGPSGSGKTTLLKLLCGTLLPSVGQVSPAKKAFAVPQRPETMLLSYATPRAYLMAQLQELEPDQAQRRLGETVGYFSMASWLEKPMAQLSGGQCQLLAIAGGLAQGGDLLILDEPTAQLDPIAAGDLVGLLRRLCRELCLTIVLSEHRTEELFPLADQVLFLEAGKVLAQGSPQAAADALSESSLLEDLPSPVRVHAGLHRSGPAPITLAQGREMLRSMELSPTAAEEMPKPEKISHPVLKLHRLWFRYEQDSPDLIRELSLSLAPGEIYAVLGGNGAGKSTLLSLLSGKNRPYSGKMTGISEALLVPQNPLPFLGGIPIGQQLPKGHPLLSALDLERLADQTPETLSCGECQRAAMALGLYRNPKILLLDEPTRGMDPVSRNRFCALLRKFAEAGHSVLMVSHDVEFCAIAAHRCGLFFDGRLIAQAPPKFFFSGNTAYTTGANRMGRNWFPQAITCGDLIRACTL